MEKDKVFFGEAGLTSTSASFVANLCKEAYRGMEDRLSSTNFLNTDVGLFSSDITRRTSTGISQDELNSIPSVLEKISSYKSLVAWLREALKSKTRLISEAQGLSDSEIAETLGIEIPSCPQKAHVPDEDEVLATFNIKQRNRAYYLNTLCAQIGQFIHPDGTLAMQRQMLQKYISAPHEVRGEGRDAMLYAFTPSVGITDVDKVYFELQQKYREYQAELNSIKHGIETTIQEAERNASAEYTKATSDYMNQMRDINAKIAAYRKEQVVKAQSLKIVIPDSLKAIYEEVSKMGKK